MSKPLLASDFRVGATAAGSGYDILRVTADPRTGGLTADLGTLVEFVATQGSIMLAKYASWDTAWRVPGEGPLYPKTAAEFLSATKLTPSALYLYDQMLSDVYDASGNGNTLTVANTPTFQQSLEGKVGIWYDGATDKHDAAVNDPAAGSFIWGCEAALINDPGAAGLNGFLGRLEGGGADGFAFYFAAGVNALIRDAAGNAINQIFGGSNAAMTSNPRVPYLIQGQVDRTAGRYRGRMSRGGTSFATFDVALGVVGTLSKAGQRFGSGALLGGLNGGGWVPYSYYVTGAQTEGANVLRDTAVGLGWEIA